MRVIDHIKHGVLWILAGLSFGIPILGAYVLWNWLTPLASIPGALLFIFIGMPIVGALFTGAIILALVIVGFVD